MKVIIFVQKKKEQRKYLCVMEVEYLELGTEKKYWEPGAELWSWDLLKKKKKDKITDLSVSSF